MLFRLAVLFKGLDGGVETLAALVLLVLPGQDLPRLVADAVTRDLLGPPDGALARHVVAGTAEVVSGDRTFVVTYLALHGLVKVALVVALLRRWRPAYPAAAVVLGAFVGYEVDRAVRTGSVLLPFLAALDVVVVVLVWREYRRLPPCSTRFSP